MDSSHSTTVNQQSIGQLFRDFGEVYIRKFNHPLHHIKLIRAIRVCKTPTLGGRVILCKKCGHEHFIYLSCGHSHCPLCQSIKRIQWQEKIKNKLLAVPYIHSVFTVPQEIHFLFKANPKVMYNLLLRTAWLSVKTLCRDPDNVGGLPGMISVLHSFGSDLKFHPHVHALITFGGWNTKKKNWVFPKRKFKLAKFSDTSNTFRDIFIKNVERLIDKNKIQDHGKWPQVKILIQNKRWNVANSKPSFDTEHIELYLARYINRQAVSQNKIQYLKDTQQVHILYNDYKNQIAGQPAPKATKKLHPIDAIAQIMQHVLPPYFQKSRYFGIHHHVTWKQIKDIVPKSLMRHSFTPRTTFQILKQLIKDQNPFQCAACKSTDYQIQNIKPDSNWVKSFLWPIQNKGDPFYGLTKLKPQYS